ncbi:MAG: aldehyde dehydrogenase (NAD+) [Verrucomicrobiales bacterium]|jgi:aldehyde dehydrogenase (NAD+)
MATTTSLAAQPNVRSTIERLRSTVAAGTTRSLDWRESQIDAVLRFAKDHTEALLTAMESDLGRPHVEGWLADVGQSISEAEYVKKRFRKWAAPRRSRVSLAIQPASAKVVPEPLGVALIISPWNYPVNLALIPLVAALAAGNAVVLKQSENASATTALIATELPKYLDEAAFAVFEGGVDVSTALLAERFDHIFFTGSTKVGRIVMEAAAKHLTPVILELGGKSPVIVADDADLDVAASRIAWGKGFNAGQTCIAPDYILVTEKNRDALVDKIAHAWTRFYGPDIQSSADFGRIVNAQNFERLTALLEGNEIAFGGDRDAATKFLSPTLLVDPDLDSDVMTEEIFGPVLPIITVEDVDAATRFVNERPKPLALYVFSGSDEVADYVLRHTSSGGACVNHTLLQFTPHELAFGGVGASGMGRYHGRAGFDALSNLRGVIRKPTRGENNLGYPPYTERKSALLRKLK